jgi:BirA family biotin operon repressor/biotin-[acetyl-CoA-carboxylase] ligase
VYLSCLKRYDRGFAALAGLSLAVGVMVLRAIESFGIAGAGLKWPNDVLAAGGKLAGVLVELSGEYQGPCTAVVGVGLNLRLTDTLRAQAGQPACDLATLAGDRLPDRNIMAARLIATLVAGLQEFERGGFASFADEYARHDLLLGRSLKLSGARSPMEGVGAGVDARGALQLHLRDGTLASVDSADITVRRA